MANFNDHKHYFRAAVWDAGPDGTAVAVSSPGGFGGGGLLEGGVLSGSRGASEGTADAARDIARSPFGHEH